MMDIQKDRLGVTKTDIFKYKHSFFLFHNFYIWSENKKVLMLYINLCTK